MRSERHTPAAGIALCIGVLSAQAVAVLAGALVILAYLPQTEAFQAAKAWCLTASLPIIDNRFGLGLHSMVDLAVVVPTALILGSIASLAFGAARAARRARSSDLRDAISRRADGSLIVGGTDPVFASAGIVRPRILVSAGALAALEDDELEAGLAHEQGHVVRRHGLISVLGLCLFAAARPIPGAGAAHRGLHFWLERDADEYAIRRTGDRLALASAICKVARAHAAPQGGAALALDGRAGVSERLVVLCGADGPVSRRVNVAAWTAAGALAILSIGAVMLLVAVASPISAFDALLSHTPALALCA